MAVDAIIFDFDGVIIDTETPDMEVWQAFYKEHGLDLSPMLWLRRVGYNEDDAFDPIKHFEQVTQTKLDEARRENQYQRYLERCTNQPVLPGVLNMIQQAKAQGIKLAIASSSYYKWVGRWLEKHQLRGYFDCVRTREDVATGKPAPDLYLSAVECLGVPKERCIAIEDSPTGMQAALAAGLRVIAVPNALTSLMDHPDVTLTLASLAELDLPALLSRF